MELAFYRQGEFPDSLPSVSIQDEFVLTGLMSLAKLNLVVVAIHERSWQTFLIVQPGVSMTKYRRCNIGVPKPFFLIERCPIEICWLRRTNAEMENTPVAWE
ncbi:MAG: hypothetical protein IIA59_00515 [Candidatus Marinimicrobia bacterium]|nr:hypothetical protein [Candidatus Neomarinimicrobiota bacterium]